MAHQRPEDGGWSACPVADDSRSLAREFLDALADLPANAAKPIGVRVPSVLSSSDFNVLVDPSRKAECTGALTTRIPFNTLRATRS